MITPGEAIIPSPLLKTQDICHTHLECHSGLLPYLQTLARAPQPTEQTPLDIPGSIHSPKP